MSVIPLAEVMKLRARLDDELLHECVADAAQAFTRVLSEELGESAVLFRLFVTVPFGALAERERTFALGLARARQFEDALDDETPVVCLLGSSGKLAKWNDRHQSRAHLAIPLTETSFIQTIPMIARLMSDMDTGLDWLEKQKSRIVVKSFGKMARLLYVENAATAVTADGFKLIPDQEFVKEHGVKTVLGIGGAYLGGSFVCALLFTNEVIPRRTVEKFMPLINSFKIATMKLVSERRFFA